MAGTASIVAAEATEQDIAALFDTWNQALRSGDPEKVADLYAERSILLPTLSNTPRLTRAEKVDYFRHFLEHRPSGEIVMRQISIGADIAVDTPFSPAETMSQPLTASNAMVMAFNAPDTSAPFC